MTKEILFKTMKVLINKLDDFKRTQTIRFVDLDEKVMLKNVYQQVHGNVQIDLSCSTCIMFYLNQLVAYYEREYPEYLKSLEPVQTDAVEAIVEAVSKPKLKRRKK